MCGIAAPDLPHFTHIVGMAQAVGFRHVQRDPGVPVVDDLENMVRQEIEDARLQDGCRAFHRWD